MHVNDLQLALGEHERECLRELPFDFCSAFPPSTGHVHDIAIVNEQARVRGCVVSIPR
jgi:hypothetical protein